LVGTCLPRELCFPLSNWRQVGCDHDDETDNEGLWEMLASNDSAAQDFVFPTIESLTHNVRCPQHTNKYGEVEWEYVIQKLTNLKIVHAKTTHPEMLCEALANSATALQYVHSSKLVRWLVSND